MNGHLVSDRIIAVPLAMRLSAAAWRSLFVLTMATGARMVEARDGYPPAKLAVGGLIVWGLFLAVMTVGNDAPPVLR